MRVSSRVLPGKSCRLGRDPAIGMLGLSPQSTHLLALNNCPLVDDDHFSDRGVLTCPQLVVVYSAGYFLIGFVPTIPVDGF